MEHAKSALLIDDTKLNLMFMKSLLNLMGVSNIYIAENAIDGVSIALDKNPDIIFCDLFMPIHTGEDFIKFLEIANLKIPVIILTVLLDKNYQDRLIKKSIRILEKPINKIKLKEILDSL